MDSGQIRRFSSRTHRLDSSFLLQHLKGARSYKRIAGYFTSSLFEVANELLESIPEVKIVCNVDIHPDDLKVAQLRESKMIGRWNEKAIETEALLNRDRYRRLDNFLQKHGQAVRVAPDSVCGFLHGKAGVIELADGKKLGFIGSMNETRSGWQRHYEILWEDESTEGIAWIEEEFNFLWNAAKELPRAVIREVRRRGYRREVVFDEINEDTDLVPAALIESPLYREGLSLQPWQQGFITECIRHYQNHGIVRLLLADEVGLGKTLSMGTAALALCLLSDKEHKARRPIVIFAPATLCEQWQTEMIDKLGIPCARWQTQKKVWLDHEDRIISPAGREQIAKCPLRIGIVSTGLMMRNSLEKQHLLGLRFGTVILDEAHKARSRQGFGKDAGSPNELLAFIREIADRSDHVLLGTATPIQTRPDDLWDLIGILHQGEGRFVLGNDFAKWHRPQEVLPILSGDQAVT
ncbi:SNF2-related protein, partial [Thiolapillus sp.]